VPPTLPVEINRGQLHDLEVVGEYSASESFDVVLRNHGEAVHVHLHLDDALSRAADLATGDGNCYVEGNGEATVRVSVTPGSEPVRGRLTVSTAYGAESADVDVTVEPGDRRDPVVVDERLSRPAGAPAPGEADETPDDGPSLPDRLSGSLPSPDTGTLLLGGLAVAAVALALWIGLGVGSGAVLLGVGVVIGGVIAALVFLMQ